MAKRKDLPRGIFWHRKRRQYEVRVSFRGKQYFCGRYDTLTLAKYALEHYRKQVIDDTFVPASQRREQWKKEAEAAKAQEITVEAYADEWIKTLGEGPRPRTPSTITTYKSTLRRHVLPTIGDTPIGQVTQQQVDDLLWEVSSKVGPGAERSTAILLRSMFNRAVKDRVGGLEAMPFTVQVRKPAPRSTAEVPTPGEVTQIIAEMPPSVRLAPLLSAVCALRPGEALGLQRGDFRIPKNGPATVAIRRQWNQKTAPPSFTAPKADSERVAPLPAFIVPIVEAHLENYVAPPRDAPLFPSVTDPRKPIGHTTYRNQWNRGVEAARVPPFVLHSLRHLGLSLLAVVGATQAEVMAYAGHRDPDAAQRYQHQLRGRDLELTAAISEQWEALE